MEVHIREKLKYRVDSKAVKPINTCPLSTLLADVGSEAHVGSSKCARDHQIGAEKYCRYVDDILRHRTIHDLRHTSP